MQREPKTGVVRPAAAMAAARIALCREFLSSRFSMVLVFGADGEIRGGFFPEFFFYKGG